MSATECPSMWASDLGGLCERLAERLRAEGAPHPGAAAVALVVRGRLGEDRHQFARRLAVSADTLARIERGEVSVRAWPARLLWEATATEGVDLDAAEST